jgi:hypothetical protein
MWFEPDAWSRSQREAGVNRLLRFVDDDTVVPRMRTSVAALKELWPTVDDRDTQLILRRIVSAVAQFDEQFGRLLAQQNRLFPALPSPAWVWS